MSDISVAHADAQIITTKKARYGRYVDTKQWDRFSEIALPHATFRFLDTDKTPLSVGKTQLVFNSTSEFTSFFSDAFARANTLHMFGPGDLEQVAYDEIEAIWAMEDEIIIKDSLGLYELRGGGYYHETWKRHKGDWFIKSLELRRTYTKSSWLAKDAKQSSKF
ncbi:hypothetical protein PFICI_02642 [Pestalotiopsis fici W106-1]|uniref:SnoaL-like domain-containing protein n=1 Tax=Pestalotiopsis fici (strain W106-1 / CGMCC3.15140) TaxID=1229662 RepID=W3XGQ3_PESFW|nr:uncharacterized protein PFICI_02642 [Pestalotiopsis fici W106-1]ETS84617.1 hypothetical protein PFICI_02642 [Pestalotiopsis fici W106-1]